MSDREELLDKLAALRLKLRIVRGVCDDTLEDGDGAPKDIAGADAIDLLKYIRDDLAKEPDDG